MKRPFRCSEPKSCEVCGLCKKHCVHEGERPQLVESRCKTILQVVKKKDGGDELQPRGRVDTVFVTGDGQMIPPQRVELSNA